MKSFFLSCLLTAGLFLGSSFAAPIISEFVAENSAGLLDQDGATSDWIEIHNPDATAVDMAGWSLTDDAALKAKWVFPSVTIQPGGYLIVYASGKNRAVSGQELHTNFALATAGEYLALFMPGGATATSEFSPKFPGQKANQAYGIAQTSVREDLVSSVTPSFLIPQTAGDLPANWNQTTVTGGTWLPGTAPGALGYDVGVVPVTSNIASIGTTSQSSELGGYPASIAVDGNTGNFTHTSGSSADANAWWQDLFPVTQNFSKIILFNRGGGCCPERLRNITVEVFDSTNTAVYTSPLLNPNNSLNGPGSITVDIFAALGTTVAGNRVRVTRTGGGGSTGDHDNYVLSLGEVQIFATAVNTVNVARNAGSVATQSSEYGGFPASLGIDGNAANFTHTSGQATDPNPWWQVVMTEEASISNVVIFNRSGCCGQRLADITVQILDIANTVKWTSPVFNPANALNGPSVIYVDVAGLNGAVVKGTKVKISRTGGDFVLSLAEVQVNALAPPVTYNAAQSIGVAVAQSSEYGGFPATLAIDGLTNNFTHTSGSPADANAWLQVSLPNDVAVANLVIYNRSDGCCPERLRNFTVDVLDQSDQVVWTSGLLNSNNTAPQSPYQLNLLSANPNGVLGRKVKITRTGGGGVSDHDSYTLAIGELQINAIVGAGPVVDTNVALGGTATGSSNIGFPEGNAINGNYGDFTHTASTDNNAKWTLDLGARKLISSVTLFNRTSCCGSRMRDITVTIRDTDNATVVFQSNLLNAENAGYTFPAGPGQISVDISAIMGGAVPGRFVEVKRTPDPDLSGVAGNGNVDESNVLSLGEVVVMGRALDTYLPLLATNVKDAMYGKNTSAFVRYPFAIASPSTLKTLKLRVRNDDAFVAYLNGVKVAEGRTPATTPWNAVAPTERDDVSSLAWEEIDISSFIGLLNAGANNVLAVQGMTAGLTDSDFLLQTQLIANSVIVNGFASYLTTPTPGAQNNSAWFIDTVADTSFSVKRGFYSTPQTVTITTTTPDAQIYYTTNGEEPEPGYGTLYSGAALTISQTTVLRARAFKTNWKPTNVDTNTYIFLDDVLSQASNGQAPAGWPTSWGANTVNYGMDANIRTLYGDTALKDALKQLPTVSVVTEMGNLFDPATGIYANAGGHGEEWERPASFEWLDPASPEGTQGKIQQNFGLRIRGGASRSNTVPKHSFRAYFRGEYGAGKLNFPIFGNAGTTQHDVIDLASSQNYSWQGGDTNDTMLRDPFARTTLLATGSPSCRNRYFHLYLNGLYWGLYYFDERVSAGLGEAYFGGNADDYDVIKTANHNGGFATEATSGYLDTQPLPGGGTTKAAWKLLWNKARALAATPSAAAYFEILGRNPDGTRNPTLPVLVDETSLIDYLLTIFYTGDGDAPLSWFLGDERANNWFCLKNRNDNDHGFVFFNHDAEHTLGTAYSQVNRTGPWPANPAAATNQNNFIYSNPQWLFQDLCTSPEFRIKVADRAHKHFFNGGVMTTTSSQARIDGLASEINLAVKAHAQRWGDTARSPALNATDWTTAVAGARNWLSGRTETVVQQLRNYRLTSALAVGSAPLYPNVVAPVFNQFGGNVPASFGVTMTSSDVPIGVIYYTTDGSDPRAIGGGIAGAEYSSTVVITSTSTVKARTLKAGEWSALTEAAFLVDVTPATNLNVVISELHYHPTNITPTEATGLNATDLAAYQDSDVFEFIELTNLSTSSVDLSGAVFDGISYTFPSGSIFLPGARILLVKNQAAFGLRYGNSIVPNGVYGGKLSNNGETITLTSSTGSVIASVTYVGAGESDGGGPSLVLIRPEDHSYDASHQRSSIEPNGNPGASDSLRLTTDPNADNDGDGYKSFVEYAMGTSDTSGSSIPASPIVVTHSGGNIEIRFPFKGNADDVTLVPQGSSDLSTWLDARTLATTTQIISGPAPGEKIMIISGPSPIADGPRYYYRMQVNLR